MAHLSENQVDIWCAELPDEWDSQLMNAYRKILTSEETERYVRFSFEKDRRQFLLTRALVRDVLSRYLGLEPAALVLVRNKYGKPTLAEPQGCSIAFSLSHTKGVAICAVASGQMIGVDIENLQRSPRHGEIAKRFFTASESAFLESLEDCQKRTEFLRIWTLKEAFVKALGLGLSLPLNSFEIKTFPDRPPSVSFVDGIRGNEATWQFLQICLERSFHIAIALNWPKPKELAVKFSTITPLTCEIGTVVLKPNRLNEWEIEGI